MASSERIFYLVCGILLFVGGIVFIWGGSQHPPTDARLGAVSFMSRRESAYDEADVEFLQHAA